MFTTLTFTITINAEFKEAKVQKYEVRHHALGLGTIQHAKKLTSCSTPLRPSMSAANRGPSNASRRKRASDEDDDEPMSSSPAGRSIA
jgi:hypothetical protein